MALPTTSYTVAGRVYTTRLLPASEALVMLPKVVALLGNKIVELLFMSGEDDLATMFARPEVQAGILHNLSERAESKNGLLLLRDLTRHTTLRTTSPDGTEAEIPLLDIYDDHFAGELMAAFHVAINAGRASFTKPSDAK